MKSRRLSEFLAQFLDSRAPLLFIAASLMLAMLGNALYELVLLTFGEQPVTLIGIIVGAALIFPLLFWLLRRAIETIARRTPIIEVEPAEQIKPHPGLILPVGLSQPGPERAILEWHLSNATLRDCWLIASPEARKSAKLSDLRQWLVEQNVDVHTVPIRDATSLEDVFRAAMQALRETQALPRALPVAVDITGGTAVMSVGLALAARNWNASLQYYPAVYGKDGTLIIDSATAPKQITFVPVVETIS
ncbi:MAG: hypothetical protein NZ699_05965 [Roseiflexus sp.]|nr:hypothetical protein [Roseiflexus sp.]